MMLGVKGQLAATVGVLDFLRCRGAGLPPQMDDLRLGTEEHRFAMRANGGTQIDVFRVHEESRVETAGLVEIPPTNQETGAADPIHETSPPRHAIDRCRDESPSAVVAANEQLLSEL